MDCSLPGSSVHGFSRQECWSGVPLPSLLSVPIYPFFFRFFSCISFFRILNRAPCALQWKVKVKVTQSCPTLCDPMDCILEWVAFPFSWGSSQPRDQTQVSCIAGRLFTSWATREALGPCWLSILFIVVCVCQSLIYPSPPKLTPLVDQVSFLNLCLFCK